jgi:hypothetical protein
MTTWPFRLLAVSFLGVRVPTRVYMAAGQNVETGQIQVFAEDGATLEYTSPQLTILPGDIWESRYDRPAAVAPLRRAYHGHRGDAPLAGCAPGYRSPHR